MYEYFMGFYRSVVGVRNEEKLRQAGKLKAKEAGAVAEQ
jgi:hypothetical protein